MSKYHHERDVQYQTYAQYKTDKHRKVKDTFKRFSVWAEGEIKQLEKALAATEAARSTPTTSQGTTAGSHHHIITAPRTIILRTDVH